MILELIYSSRCAAYPAHCVTNRESNCVSTLSAPSETIDQRVPVNWNPSEPEDLKTRFTRVKIQFSRSSNEKQLVENKDRLPYVVPRKRSTNVDVSFLSPGLLPSCESN